MRIAVYSMAYGKQSFYLFERKNNIDLKFKSEVYNIYANIAQNSPRILCMAF